MKKIITFVFALMLVITNFSPIFADDSTIEISHEDESYEVIQTLNENDDISILGLSPIGEELYKKTISSLQWINRNGKISLSITWKDALFDHSYSSVFQLLVNIWSGSGYWPDTPTANGTMRDQFECHYNFARNKNPWNLEPWRPYVGYFQTVLNLCNP